MPRALIAPGEHYHIFNRGVDKRDVFGNFYDLDRFIQSLKEFNNKEPIGSIYQNSFYASLSGPTTKLAKTSWGEYAENKEGLCEKSIILEQFNSTEEYKKFALAALENIQENKKLEKESIDYFV